MLKVKFFGHCAKRKAVQLRFFYYLIWEFIMTLYASDIVSSYVAYKNNFKASYSDMLHIHCGPASARCYLWLFTLYINIKIGKNSC